MATFIEALLPSVHDTLSVREALSKLAQCERHIRVEGVTSILDNFNVLYSCLGHVKELKASVVDDILSMLHQGVVLLETDLRRMLVDKLSSEQRVKYLHTLKMFVYLLVEFATIAEKKHTSARETDLMSAGGGGGGGGGGRKKKNTAAAAAANDLDMVAESTGSSGSGSRFDWPAQKEKLLAALAKLLQLSVQKLWDPPIAEEQFVISVTNLCYKFMENMATGSGGGAGGASGAGGSASSALGTPTQRKAIKEHVCHILAICIKKYNHSYGACVMIVQTLPHCEHYSSLYAELIGVCVAQLGYEAILPDLLREFRHVIVSTGSGAGGGTATGGGGGGGEGGADKDNQTMRAYSQFLIELGDRLATHLLPYLSLVAEFLDDESYLMRNATLHIYGQVVVRVLGAAACANDLKLKQTRNELLDALIEHMHDANAVTRSRTIQVWRHVSDENALPLSYMARLMSRCVGRMQDTASSVRKSAFQLLCDLIRKNPYGIRSVEMSVDAIERECAKEEAVLAELTGVSGGGVGGAGSASEEQLVADTNKLAKQSSRRQRRHHKKKHRRRVASDEEDEVDTEEEEEEEEEEDEEEKEEDEEMETNQMVADVAASTNEAVNEQQQQQIIVQQSKVNYLRDMLAFVQRIAEAMPILSRLLFSKTQTDVLEVISFFVTCYEHGLSEMIAGIRRMLSLLVMHAGDGGEKTIRDAVLAAYKRLYLQRTSTGGGSSSALHVAKQLIKLTHELSVCERRALAELVGEFTHTGELDNSVIKVLWEVLAAAGNSNDHEQEQTRLCALILLGMIIKRVPEIGRANIQTLLNFGLDADPSLLSVAAGGGVVTDMQLLRYAETCLALSYITPDANTKRLTEVVATAGNAQNNAPPTTATGKSSSRSSKTKTGSSSSSSKQDQQQQQQRRLQFNTEPYKLVNTHALFERLQALLVATLASTETHYWTPFAENAMLCVFKLADNPIAIIDSLVLKLIDAVPLLRHLANYKSRAAALPPVPLFNDESAPSTATQATSSIGDHAEEAGTSYLSVNVNTLKRFLALVGILATKLLVFLNQSVVCELKRRKLCKENRAIGLSINSSSSSNTSLANNSNKSSTSSRRRLSSKLMRTLNCSSDLAAEQEMAMSHGASGGGGGGGGSANGTGKEGNSSESAEDVECLFVDAIVDLKVAFTQANAGFSSTLAQFVPACVELLRHPATYPDEGVQLAAALTFVKLMCLSAKLCTRDNLQLVFTLMEKSSNARVRAQLIVGVGDLVYRFPNALEPWTSHLYLPLRDQTCAQVRVNTIRVLSHLILKEMIKTRGQIYEIALCTIDTDPQISALAKLFFQELAQRNNGLVIYNAMPDIISQLSGGSGGGAVASALNQGTSDASAGRHIEEDEFRTVVTYLFTFIKRDKQCETLIEKLCYGFRAASASERKCRDLAFCLSKLQLSDNGIKKLKETFKWYADKMTIQPVYELFKNGILKNARRLPSMRNETKAIVDEIEKLIEEVRQKGLDNNNAPNATNAASAGEVMVAS